MSAVCACTRAFAIAAARVTYRNLPDHRWCPNAHRWMSRICALYARGQDSLQRRHPPPKTCRQRQHYETENVRAYKCPCACALFGTILNAQEMRQRKKRIPLSPSMIRVHPSPRQIPLASAVPPRPSPDAELCSPLSVKKARARVMRVKVSGSASTSLCGVRTAINTTRHGYEDKRGRTEVIE